MKKFFPLILIFILVLLFFYPIFSLFFSQDDFFHFRISQTDGTLASFMNMLWFRSSVYFYRPIFRELFYNLYFGFFGLEELPYRLTQFFIHFVNIGLTYVVINKLTENKLVAWVAAVTVGLSSANVGTLSFLGGGIQTSGMTVFFLFSLNYYLNFLESGLAKNEAPLANASSIFSALRRSGILPKQNSSHSSTSLRLRFSAKADKILSLVFFLLALASHELALALPFILLVLTVFKKRKISELIPYFIFSLILIALEIGIKGLPVGEKQYGFNFSPVKLFNAYEWYFVWGLGIPEMLLDFIGPGIHLNPNLMKYWGDYFKTIFPLFLIVVVLMLASFKKVIREKMFWFFLLWFIIGISPVVLLPLHRASYYLASVLPAIGGILGYVFYFLFTRKKALGVIFLVALFILSNVSVNLSLQTYWAVSRGKAAHKLLSDIRTKFPTLPPGANVYFTNDPSYPFISVDWGGSSKQASVILSGSDALQVVYHDPTIKVYYEDLEKPPADNNLFTLPAVVATK